MVREIVEDDPTALEDCIRDLRNIDIIYFLGGIQAWEYDIEFDERNGHLRRVVAGDNAPFARYIEAHNRATDSARELVGQLVPLAEKLGVTIALENVWNNLWVRPEHFRWLITACGSPRVKAYYDVGNHEKYLVPAEQWIRTLGGLIAKVHIKDFTLNPNRQGGKFVHPREGGIHWPAVRQALEEVNYNGWLTVEDDGQAPVEYRRRLDEIIAGR
jgi:hexulose-6-phosphate isomerase